MPSLSCALGSDISVSFSKEYIYSLLQKSKKGSSLAFWGREANLAASFKEHPKWVSFFDSINSPAFKLSGASVLGLWVQFRGSAYLSLANAFQLSTSALHILQSTMPLTPSIHYKASKKLLASFYAFRTSLLWACTGGLHLFVGFCCVTVHLEKIFERNQENHKHLIIYVRLEVLIDLRPLLVLEWAWLQT